jgi:hypothetical protein
VTLSHREPEKSHVQTGSCESMELHGAAWSCMELHGASTGLQVHAKVDISL